MKKIVSATIDENLVNWIKKQTKDKRFRNKSHIIEIALEKFREDIEKGE